MSGRLAAILVVAMAILFGLAAPAAASTAVEKLMMPGQLSQAHAKLEEDCANCHKVLQKAAQSSLCISCHKDVQKDLDAKTGFHGRDVIVAKSECYACHVEHKGRDNPEIQFEPSTFNHGETRFALEGGHSLVPCASCHKPGKKYREAPQACADCHGEKQPHKGNLGKQCETCHSVESWKKLKPFDHNKTKYPLRGAHAKAACVGCHAGEIYAGLSQACNDCHAIRDVHARKFGLKCEDCHSLEAWKPAKFDHAKTRFPLQGAHAKAQCADCHGGNITAKLAVTCISCHKAQDVHKAQLGEGCGDCHNASAWRANVKFDHGLTSYPLTGLHALVACEGCHETRAYKGAATDCYACHRKADVHEGRFATACANCHSPLGWKRVTFDHARDGHYALDGAHAKVGCYDCHTAKAVQSAKLPTDCYSCHKVKDVHRGAFGTNCARCHTTQTFRAAIIRQ
ncbi:MAG: cytochrome C [Alphaproteobacteria bacterium]|nr:cytochrome C [Alphaproteobacteria bacterium]